MRVELSRFIDGDLAEIAIYIARDSPRRAATFVAELRAAAVVIGRKPQIYALRPDMGKDVRACAEGQYIIFFGSWMGMCGLTASSMGPATFAGSSLSKLCRSGRLVIE